MEDKNAMKGINIEPRHRKGCKVLWPAPFKDGPAILVHVDAPPVGVRLDPKALALRETIVRLSGDETPAGTTMNTRAIPVWAQGLRCIIVVAVGASVKRCARSLAPRYHDRANAVCMCSRRTENEHDEEQR